VIVAYPRPTADHITFFREHGYLVVEDAIDPADLEQLERSCAEILEHKETMAFDWAWSKDKPRDEREFRIVQASPTHVWPERFADAPFRRWAIDFASALMGMPMDFWYDQFLAKPPDIGAPTLWHQDEAYWGRNLDDLGCTAWMPFHDVGVENGCMHFIDGGHLDGVLEHRQPDHIQSDLLFCEPDETRTVACPVSLGAVTFHHSKTPHMTSANTSGEWRRILTQHLRAVGAPGEGDHYSWKIYVNQFSGERTKPATR
jgi:ectoine hydroxylase-related dioxygenase (phytanoyl-CoA dioxygenase family)